MLPSFTMLLTAHLNTTQLSWAPGRCNTKYWSSTNIPSVTQIKKMQWLAPIFVFCMKQPKLNKIFVLHRLTSLNYPAVCNLIVQTDFNFSKLKKTFHSWSIQEADKCLITFSTNKIKDTNNSTAKGEQTFTTSHHTKKKALLLDTSRPRMLCIRVTLASRNETSNVWHEKYCLD